MILTAETRRVCRLRGIRGPCSDHDGRVSEVLGEFRPAGQRNSKVISREIAQIGVFAPASRVVWTGIEKRVIPGIHAV